MVRYHLRTALFLIVGINSQWGFTKEKKLEHESSCIGLRAALCATPQSYVFLDPPEAFSPQMEVSGCYCEYQGRVLLLLRNPEKPQGNTWCIPGGKLKKGESALQAVIREVWEETGLCLTPESLNYCLKVYVRFPGRDFVLHLFRAELSEISKTFEISPNEHSGYRWVAIGEALKMPLIPGGGDCIRLAFHDIRFH